MHRVLITPGSTRGRSITICERERLHHLLDVLRVQPGERLECFDGQGARYVGVVRECTRREITLEIERISSDAASPAVQLTLALALIKPERFEWAIEKTTELGVDAIMPMVTSRTTIRLRAGDESPRLHRWRRIAESAAAQCGRATVPRIEGVVTFNAVLGALRERQAIMLTLADHEAVGFTERAARLDSSCEAVILIGPEGDFSPDEVVRARRQGMWTARLDGPVLRSETAAMVAAAILRYTRAG